MTPLPAPARVVMLPTARGRTAFGLLAGGRDSEILANGNPARVILVNVILVNVILVNVILVNEIPTSAIRGPAVLTAETKTPQGVVMAAP